MTNMHACCVGNVTAGAVSLKLGLAIINGLEIIGTDSCTAAELAQVFAFLDATGLRPEIARVLTLEDAAVAHACLEAGGVRGRQVIALHDEW